MQNAAHKKQIPKANYRIPKENYCIPNPKLQTRKSEFGITQVGFPNS